MSQPLGLAPVRILADTRCAVGTLGSGQGRYPGNGLSPKRSSRLRECAVAIEGFVGPTVRSSGSVLIVPRYDNRRNCPLVAFGHDLFTYPRAKNSWGLKS